MKHIVLMCIAVFCVSLGAALNAEADTASIRELIAQVSDSTIAIENRTLEQIALMTYDVLLNVPLIGLNSSREELEALITLRNTLETHSGVQERLLALRIQEGVDRTIFFEVARRTIYLMKKSVSPPYQDDALQLETVTALLQTNAIAEQEAIQYIRNRDGQFATFCRSKNFSIEDFLTAEAVKAFPVDLKSLMRGILSVPGGPLKGARKEIPIEDILFVSTLNAIDQAKDIRLVYDLFFDSSPDSYREQIDQRLTLHPTIRISNGLPNTADSVVTTIEKYIGNVGPDHYLVTVTLLFSTYFTQPETVATKFDEIFFRYTGKHGGFSRFMIDR